MPASQRTLSGADVRYFVDEHCFPTGSGGRVGAELEWLAVDAHNPDRRAPLPRILSGLEGLDLPAGSCLTVEPGGQVELSSPPAANVGAACAGLNIDVAETRRSLADVGVALVGAGIDRIHPPCRLVDSPRYSAMEAFFDNGGEHAPRAGRTMMCNTASVQVNVDASGSSDRETRWRLADAVGPVLAAAFANSPVALGRPTGWHSARLAAWQAIDRTRTAPAFSGRGCVEDWAAYALNARVMMTRSGSETLTPVRAKCSFGQWMEVGHELGWPTVEDFAYHLTTLFPPVRPKGWLELRMIDALPDPWWEVAIAVTTAVLDDPETASGAAELAGVAGAERLAERWAEAARWGLTDPVMAKAALGCFDLTLKALPRLGAQSTTIAATEEYIERYVIQGRCPADDAVLVGVSA